MIIVTNLFVSTTLIHHVAVGGIGIVGSIVVSVHQDVVIGTSIWIGTIDEVHHVVHVGIVGAIVFVRSSIRRSVGIELVACVIVVWIVVIVVSIVVVVVVVEIIEIVSAVNKP